MQDFFTEFTSQVRARLSNSLFFCFIFSWVFVNRDVLLYWFFSEDSYNRKLRIIDAISLDLFDHIFYPLLGVAVYMFLLPVIAVLLQFIKLVTVDKLTDKYADSESRKSQFRERRKQRGEQLYKRVQENEIINREERKVETITKKNALLKEKNVAIAEQVRLESEQTLTNQTLMFREKELHQQMEKNIELRDLLDQQELLSRATNEIHSSIKLLMDNIKLVYHPTDTPSHVSVFELELSVVETHKQTRNIRVKIDVSLTKKLEGVHTKDKMFHLLVSIPSNSFKHLTYDEAEWLLSAAENNSGIQKIMSQFGPKQSLSIKKIGVMEPAYDYSTMNFAVDEATRRLQELKEEINGVNMS